MSHALSDADDRLLGIKEVEGIIGQSRATINRMIKKDAIPSLKVGKRRMFRKSDIMAWIADLKTDAELRARVEAAIAGKDVPDRSDAKANTKRSRHFTDSQFDVLSDAIGYHHIVPPTFDGWLQRVAENIIRF